MSDYDPYVVSHLFQNPKGKSTFSVTSKALLLDFIGGWFILIFLTVVSDESPLELTFKYFKFVSRPISSGIAPTSPLEDKFNESVEILASGEKKFKNSNILKIYQDASIVRINGSQGSLNYKLDKKRHVYFVLSKGKIFIDETEINERDGVYINGLNEINFDFKKTSEIILVDMLINN